jgi:hypothetical protein
LRRHVYFEYALQDGGETVLYEAGMSKSDGTANPDAIRISDKSVLVEVPITISEPLAK